MKSRDSCSWNLGRMIPTSEADSANISNSIATSRTGATGRLVTSLMGTTPHNIPTPNLLHNSREVNVHTVPGAFAGAERLSPGFGQEVTGSGIKLVALIRSLVQFTTTLICEIWKSNSWAIYRDPSTGAMSIKANTPTIGHVHGTWSQR